MNVLSGNLFGRPSDRPGKVQRCLTSITLVLVFGCSSPTSPVESNTVAFGRVEGTVSIGPICPVEQVDHPCPTPPEAYAARKVTIYDQRHASLLFVVDINSSGSYGIEIPEGHYVVDLKPVGIDRSSDVPKPITISRGMTVGLNIRIDTGIR